jgi:hypothetical protein
MTTEQTEDSVQLLVEVTLLAAGYHQHHRQWRRNRAVNKANTNTPAAVPATPPAKLDLATIVERARNGDMSVLTQLREHLKDPAFHRQHGDLAASAQ